MSVHPDLADLGPLISHLPPSQHPFSTAPPCPALKAERGWGGRCCLLGLQPCPWGSVQFEKSAHSPPPWDTWLWSQRLSHPRLPTQGPLGLPQSWLFLLWPHSCPLHSSGEQPLAAPGQPDPAGWESKQVLRNLLLLWLQAPQRLFLCPKALASNRLFLSLWTFFEKGVFVCQGTRAPQH